MNCSHCGKLLQQVVVEHGTVMVCPQTAYVFDIIDELLEDLQLAQTCGEVEEVGLIVKAIDRLAGQHLGKSILANATATRIDSVIETGVDPGPKLQAVKTAPRHVELGEW